MTNVVGGALVRGFAGSVPAVWPSREEPGPVTAALLFRVGASDESLPQRGITHLLEHLVLSLDEPGDISWNGFVDLTKTVFYARGERDQVRRWLEHVVERLWDVPTDRFHHERRVLQAEGLRSSSTAGQYALRLRYGLQGPGIAELREYGLRRLEPDEVLAWRDRYFTAGNAAVWSTVGIDDMDLSLPPGQRRPPRVPATLPAVLPARVQFDSPSILLSCTAPRSTAVAAAARHLQRRCQRRLRHERGIAYHVASDYEPFTTDLAFVTLATEVDTEHRREAEGGILEVLDTVTRHGVDADELAADHADMVRSMTDPMALTGRLDAAARRALLGDEPLDEGAWLDELRSLTGEAVAWGARQLRSAALLLTPIEGPPPPGFREYDVEPRPVAVGDSLRPRYALRSSDERLFFGPQGLLYRGVDGESVAVGFETCAGGFSWEDGTRSVHDLNGAWLTVDVEEWKGAKRAIEVIDRHVSVPLIPMGKAPERHPDYHRHATRFLWRQRLRALAPAAVAVVAAVFLIAISLADAATRGSLVRGAVLLVVLALVTFSRSQKT